MFDYDLIYKTKEGDNYTLMVDIGFSSSHDFFDGHFEGFLILPAVAQLFVVQTIAEQEWGDLGVFQSLRQVKFCDPIYSNFKQQLKIDYCKEKGSLSFSYTQLGLTEDGGLSKKSTGKIYFDAHEDISQ